MAQKRKAGRPPKNTQPAKKTRLSSQVKQESPEKEATPQTPAAEEDIKPTLLPNKTADHRPLPTLPEVQPINLLEDEYQSIESSGTLAASLERTRQRWLSGEFFERYWVKTSGRKDAKPVPEGNPNKSWMKYSGPCTIIIEPMIFETQFYVSYDPAITSAAQQKNAIQQQQQQHNTPSPYGTPYRSQTTPIQPSHQHQSTTPASGVRPAAQSGQHIHQAPAHVTSSVPAKQSPDPVIQLLASRAATDPTLKELMKIVATGSANPEQLKTFQGHIDELNALVATQNASQNASQTASNATSAASSPAVSAHQQTSAQPVPPQAAQVPPPPRPIQQPPYFRPRPPVQPVYPAVFEFFNSPGASVDRFRFPQYSIVEPLGSYSILASFLVFRKGKDAADPSFFSPDVEYFEPITIKMDVHPSNVRVLEDIKKSVKAPNEVRSWMEEQMRTKKRAPMRYLPLRLPHKSQITESEEEVAEPPPVEVKKRPYKKKAEKEEAPSPAPPPPPPPPPPPVDEAAEGRRRSLKRSTRLSNAIAT